MVCKKCGNETFKVYKIMRNRRWDSIKKEWIFDADADTREVFCVQCLTHYITSSSMEFGIKVNEDTQKGKRIPIVEFARNCEREIDKRQKRLFNE